MANDVRIEIRVDDKGYVNFSIEKDGVKRSAGFGNGASHVIEGNGGTGCTGISDAVRRLARDARLQLYIGAAWLDIDAQEARHG